MTPENLTIDNIREKFDQLSGQHVLTDLYWRGAMEFLFQEIERLKKEVEEKSDEIRKLNSWGPLDL